MKKRILIVDDDAAIRNSLKKVLEGANYEVLLACNGPEAVRYSEQDLIDLLLIDLNLPLKSGWDTFECLTEHYPSLPIIIITGLPNQYEIALAASVGALLEKPVEVPILLKCIQQLLSETAEDRSQRLKSGSTQLLKRLRQQAITPYQCLQSDHSFAGYRYRSDL